METTARTTHYLREKIYLLFFLSGATGLMYEVIWVSNFGRLFGNSSYAIGTVLAAYMGGLALGSYLFGRWADRIRNGLRAYAVLVLLTGITAFLVMPLLAASKPIYSLLSVSH
ncbi:MAG: hypothetical protein EOM12_13675, partial [Verrucomicrobiae bacterium]|nr:hypothetical protein [Verrucomicrobiae bacterium]